MVKAISEIATALSCDIFITKVARCSSPETDCADALSKNNLKTFTAAAEKILHKYEMSEIPRMQDQGISICPTSKTSACSVSSGRRVPLSIISWLSDPKPDRFLGHRIMTELAKDGVDLLGYKQ